MSHPDPSAAPALARLPGPVRTAVLALGAQAGLALVYVIATGAGVASLPTTVVALAWITAGVVAVVHVDPPAVSGGPRLAAAAVGVAYGVGLAWVAGLVSPGTGAATGASVALLPPWWGPVLRYDGLLALSLFPYRVVGYAALGYLVYAGTASALASRRALVGSLAAPVAVLSCVGCAAPLLAALGVVGGAGSGAALAGGALPALGPRVHLLGTAAYLVAVGLLAGGVRWSA